MKLEVVAMENLGRTIRLLREKKGITLNAYAQELGVSPGYLSNLETGKTETIQLSLLKRLSSELGLPLLEDVEPNHEIDLRIQRAHRLLTELDKQHPHAVDYLLSTLEEGIKAFKKA
jgi:transcriptional regulator with XRE-family HTH domain